MLSLLVWPKVITLSGFYCSIICTLRGTMSSWNSLLARFQPDRKHALWGQFHQCSMRSFFVRKLHVQLFCAYVLGLYLTGVSLPAQKLCVERWWNWALVTLDEELRKIYTYHWIQKGKCNWNRQSGLHRLPRFGTDPTSTRPNPFGSDRPWSRPRSSNGSREYWKIKLNEKCVATGVFQKEFKNTVKLGYNEQLGTGHFCSL